jgi:Calx-beta domain
MRHGLSSDVLLRTRPRRGRRAALLITSVALLGLVLLGPSSAAPTASTISVFDVSTLEGPDELNHFVAVPVELSEASPVAVTVNWATKPGTARPPEAQIEGSFVDYFSGSGQVFFAPGETSKSVEVLIDGGGAVENDETFTVELSSPVNATITRGVATVTILNDDLPPPPEPGQVNVIPVGGGGQCVAVKGGAGCEALQVGQQVEIEDVLYINPRTSRVIVQSVAGNTAFYGGKFDVSEIGGGGDKPITVLRLVGGNFKAKCGKATRTTAGLNAEAKKTPVRRLWGKGKGRFRTRGRYSSGTVRGTNWITTDFCDGTDTRVVRGIVRVYDFVANKWVLLEAGDSYFAKAGKIN